MKNYAAPSPNELDILSILWDQGAATVRVVHDLTYRDVNPRSYTTTLSVMQHLAAKNLVIRIPHGRGHLYQAAVSREEILRPRLDHLVQKHFGGSLSETILALLSNGALSPTEKTAVIREIQKIKTMPAKKNTTAKKAPAKKVAKKAAVTKVAKKAAVKKVAKKAAVKKVAKKAAVTKVAKKAAVKKVAKKAAVKKVAKKAAVKKVAKKAAVTKVAKKAAVKKVAKKAAVKKAKG